VPPKEEQVDMAEKEKEEEKRKKRVDLPKKPSKRAFILVSIEPERR
jgi:hypothetical protein